MIGPKIGEILWFSLMTPNSAKMHHKAFKTIIDKQSDTKKVLSAVKSVKCQVKRKNQEQDETSKFKRVPGGQEAIKKIITGASTKNLNSTSRPVSTKGLPDCL